MLRFQSTFIVGAMIAVLCSLAGVILATETFRPSGANPPAKEFQQLVGGLGYGPAVDMSRCEFSFDPRLCEDCSLKHGPVPGAVFFCQQHACSILYCRPLVSGSE